MRTLAIIPARGGSKGIPRKNVTLLAGKPLIVWRIESALACPHIERVVVSTDDAEIAEVSRQFNAEVPFMRPLELAQDDTPSIDAILHMARWLDQNESYRPDYIMLLQPTSPLCTTDDLENAIALAKQHQADAVVSVTEASAHPYWMKRINKAGHLEDFLSKEQSYTQRQMLPAVYTLNGAIYLTRRDTLLQRSSFYGEATYAYVMPPERSIDIDSPWDLHVVDLIMRDLM